MKSILKRAKKQDKKEYNKRYDQSPKGKETRRRYSLSLKRKETRKKYDQSLKGRERSRRYEKSAKSKETNKKYRQTPKGKEIVKRGRRVQRAKRKQFGFIPLNKSFEGSEGHHIDIERVIYIPKEIHRSVWHSVSSNINMDKINKLAFDYLELEQRSKLNDPIFPHLYLYNIQLYVNKIQLLTNYM